jgi:hypothetical protein
MQFISRLNFFSRPKTVTEATIPSAIVARPSHQPLILSQLLSHFPWVVAGLDVRPAACRRRRFPNALFRLFPEVAQFCT